MEKIWVLIILLFSGCFPVPVHGQDKCFTPAQQRELMNQIDKARTCDTLLQNREQKIDSLILKSDKLKTQIEIKSDIIRVKDLTIENLVEQNRIQVNNINTLTKENKRLNRRKKLFQITTGAGLVGSGLFFFLYILK